VRMETRWRWGIVDNTGLAREESSMKHMFDWWWWWRQEHVFRRLKLADGALTGVRLKTSSFEEKGAHGSRTRCLALSNFYEIDDDDVDDDRCVIRRSSTSAEGPS
jgi:hypothetical protein